MKRFLKILGALIFCLSLITMAGWSTFENTFRTQKDVSTFSEIKHRSNVSRYLNNQQKSVIKKSRNSSVRIVSYSAKMDGIASLSGTYFTAFGKHYVLTVMHGLGGYCEFTKIVVDNKFFNCVEYIIVNVADDYAIMEVDPIPIREPLNFPRDLPKNKEWKNDLSLMTVVYHTGYPNNMGPLTFDGNIVGYSDDNYIYLNSYAWSGSSGSGVFNERGKLIGYVLALDIGMSEYGIDILEDIVVVVPASVVDWDYFYETVLKISELKKLYSSKGE
jgi:hypothetical protein